MDKNRIEGIFKGLNDIVENCFDSLHLSTIAILVNGFRESRELCERFGGEIPLNVQFLEKELRWLHKEMQTNGIECVTRT